jgi:hypothetical protein
VQETHNPLSLGINPSTQTHFPENNFWLAPQIIQFPSALKAKFDGQIWQTPFNLPSPE